MSEAAQRVLDKWKDKVPRLGCAGLVWKNTKLLFGRRAKDPGRGALVLPGGGVKFGETLEQTLKREMLEEAGIDIKVVGQFRTFELIEEDQHKELHHRVIVYMEASWLSGDATPSSDLSDVVWLSRKEITDMLEAGEFTPLIARVLREYFPWCFG